MILWALQSAILSVALIFLVHHLFQFFKSTLTVPKIKDLVNAPARKYEAMYNVIKSNGQSTNKNDNMKEELKSFFKKQMENNESSSTDITSLQYSNLP
jgi:hypothetical protein